MLSKLKKTKPAEDLPATVEAATSGGEGYPKDYAVGSLRERRLLMALRSVSIAAILGLILNIVQAFAIVSLFPLKEIRPFLVQVAEEGTVVAAVRPIQDTFDAKTLLTEKLVREYVVNRHEILRSDTVMTSRWSPSGYLGMTTSPNEYSRFRNQVGPVLEQIRGLDAQRRATVLSVSAINESVYIVDFRSESFNSCLLYTSPSPRDRTRSRMPSSA